MYSPAEFLEALESASPENKSKAILALQDGLQKAQVVIDAARIIVDCPIDDLKNTDILRLQKALKQYNKV